MKFELTKFIEVFSRSIDEFISLNYYRFNLDNIKTYYPQYHQFKVAHFSVLIGSELKLDKGELEDLFILGMLHDIGFIAAEMMPFKENNNYFINNERLIEHCLIGEKLIRKIDFNSNTINVIMFHHENWNGSGYFGIREENIPIFSRIIALSDSIDLLFNLDDISNKRTIIEEYISKNINIKFDCNVSNAAIKVIRNKKNNYFFKRCDKLPCGEIEYNWDKIISVTEMAMNIIDYKSHFTFCHSEKVTCVVDKITKELGYEEEHRKKIHIAANLHDIGKIMVSKRILEKPGELTYKEFFYIKNHPLDGENMLKKILFFENIARWVGQHHEKLNGQGYPKGLKNKEIDIESQILSVADVFVALRESRPYRRSLKINEIEKIMGEMVHNNEINGDFVDILFRNIIKINDNNGG